MDEVIDTIKAKGLLINDKGAQLVILSEEGDKAPVPPQLL
jgi:hypothetical protein